MSGVGMGMEVDPHPAPSTSHSPPLSSANQTALNPLKRSNSAPMINVLVSTSPVASTSCSHTMSSAAINIPQQPLASPGSLRNYERVRRFSASSMSLHSPTTPVKAPSRLDQIKQEERFAAPEREAAHERETQSTMQMSQSWEELSLDDSCSMLTDQKRPKSFGEPLHILTSHHYPYAGSPSPTRVGKQCFSPALQQPIRHVSLTPSPSPSPTRKTFNKRSSSPVILRQSPLGGAIKRKMELESGDKTETYFSPPKRFQPSISPGASTPDRHSVLTHPLIHSISCSSLEDTGSPEQTVPQLSHANTTSTPSSSYAFRPVRHSVDTHATDSETSDMTESTDISERSDTAAPGDSSLLGVAPLFSPPSVGKPTSL